MQTQVKRFTALLAVAFATLSAVAGELPPATENDWVAKDFRFHTGEVLPEVRLHYTTLGDPSHQAVLILHGTAGSGTSMLNPAFGGELFGPGQPFDATKYYVILPDALGHGKSSKPSDGLRTKFPRYNYDDMVQGQFRLLTEGLGIRHVRVVIGNSMGGMQTWLWGEQHPDFMDALVPMASQPTAMSGRNWLMRRMVIDAVRNDPAWNSGNYTTQPPAVRTANAFFGIVSSGGAQAYQKMAPTRAAADKLLDDRLAAPFTADANDFLYQWDSSRDYDAAPQLARIRAPLLAINSADDERNPPELRIMERELKRLKHADLYLIPASEDTRGHSTTGFAKFWKLPLQQWLETVLNTTAFAALR